ncbi:hypothetical protein AGDE_16066 [Angomonas deanei]|nr:hypothetical protein AGDE_16066 [Angomonas deanei]|eukprot:EPY17794.1 hypothetical protein AGDE_16066 [Angomonas deanei]
MTSESIPHNCGEVRSILFHPSKDLIMTATDHGHVQSWRFTQDGQQLQLTLKSSYPLATIFARHVNSSKGQLRHLYSPPYAVYTPQNEDTCGPNAKNSIVTGHTPNTGAVKLHVVDAASRSLLCTVHRTGGVELWSGYANANTVRLVTAFETMSPLERPRVHELLSSYQPISNKLLVCGTCSVVVCDLVTERLLTATEQVQPEAVDVDLPTVLTAHLYDPHLYSVGAGSTVCTYDHRQRHRPIVRYTGTAPCVMVRYMRRYPNVVAAGYSGGVVKLWDQRSNREPLLEYAINVPSEMHNSIRHMQVFPSSEKFVTVATSHNTVYCDYPNFQGPPLTSTLPSEPTATAFHHFRPLIGFSCDQNLTLCTSQL